MGQRGHGRMNNIPTDLLRTLVTVVDQRSFTKAAQVLGVTQPAVSAQIKRLQGVLGNDLFDRSASGLNLTPKGELIVNYARRLLSINDLILHVAEPNPSAQTIRVGVPSDFLGGNLPAILAGFRKRWPDLRFNVQHGALEPQLHELRQGQLDIAVGLSSADPNPEARHHWVESMVWLRGRATRLDPVAPVPLVSFREDCIYYRTAVTALNQSGRDSELVFIGPTIVSLAAAVGAGLGIMALPRSRVWSPDLMVWDDAPLPKLPDLAWGVYLREGGEHGPLENLADSMAAELHARCTMSVKQASGRSVKSTVVMARALAIS
ncbi:MAG: LysR family transcriptional regulator [Rhizobiales bacterium]|nr:LysR family transcriptional regulator [Hyphomicrobiales bacterium]